MASTPLGTAFLGMSAATCAIVFLSFFLDKSGAKNFVQAPPLDAAAVKLMLVVAAEMVAFNTAVALIYARLYNRDAAAAGAVSRRIAQLVYFVLCSTVGLLLLFLFAQPGTMDGAQDLPLGVAVVRVFLPTFGTATFFLSTHLIYAHLRSGGAGEAAAAAAGNMPITTSVTVKLLTKVTLACALVTVVLNLIAAIVVFYTE